MKEKVKSDFKKIRNRNRMIVFLVMVILSFAGLYFYHSHDTCIKDYDFVNARIACSGKRVVDKKSYTELQNEMTDLINSEINLGRADFIAIFFRDLVNGPTFGVNDDENFVPASLLKLPNVLGILRYSESNPEIMNNNLRINGDPPYYIQTFVPEKRIQKDIDYKVADLIYHSLAYSDNTADEVIYNYLKSLSEGNHDIIEETYRDLGLFDASSSIFKESVTPKGYASMFRLLYNVSFLSNTNSEFALKILSESFFMDGLRRGVPENIKIAHKFGERILESGEKQLHDCGIIYYPDNPYLLCVMTQGEDFTVLAEIVGNISEEVYKEFDSRKIN